MSFTYNLATDPTLSTVRLLIADTNAAQPIFQDDEINAFIYITSSQAIYASSMAVPTGATPPVPGVQVVSVYRAAAAALDSIASNKALLSSIVSILDVKINAAAAAKALHEQAQAWREMEDNMGHFAIAEMVNTTFQARERVWKQFLRLEAN
jgi:hypothetical protein